MSTEDAQSLKGKRVIVAGLQREGTIHRILDGGWAEIKFPRSKHVVPRMDWTLLPEPEQQVRSNN